MWPAFVSSGFTAARLHCPGAHSQGRCGDRQARTRALPRGWQLGAGSGVRAVGPARAEPRGPGASVRRGSGRRAPPSSLQARASGGAGAGAGFRVTSLKQAREVRGTSRPAPRRRPFIPDGRTACTLGPVKERRSPVHGPQCEGAAVRREKQAWLGAGKDVRWGGPSSN